MQLLNVAGAKARLARWIISHFLPHSIYVEAFGGSGAVLIAKAAVSLEVFNDLDGGLVHFFQVLASRPRELIERVDGLLYSPFTDPTPTLDPIEIASRFFLHNATTWPAANGNTFRRQRRPESGGRHLAVVFQRRKKLLDQAAARLKNVIFENQNALEIIKRYDGPNVLHYIDPPYFGERRSQLYHHEMMDEASHRELAAVLHSVQGSVVLSGYSSALYQELYSDWQLVARSAQTNARDLRVECLWIKAAVPVTLNGHKPRPVRRRTYWAKAMEEVRTLKKHGQHSGPRKKTKPGINDITPSGTIRYLIARLKRDHPDIAERLANGEFRSVRAAARAVGIKVAKSYYPLTQLRYAWRKASDAERSTFLAEIGAALG